MAPRGAGGHGHRDERRLRDLGVLERLLINLEERAVHLLSELAHLLELRADVNAVKVHRKPPLMALDPRSPVDRTLSSCHRSKAYHRMTNQSALTTTRLGTALMAPRSSLFADLR